MKKNILAARLNYGDTIGVISPSNAVTKNLSDQYDSGRKFFENMGFKVIFADNALSDKLGYAASPEEKAGDIHQMFQDQTVKAVICSQGGDTVNACLPLVNWHIIKHNPKILMGISDNSILLNVVYNKTGLVTFHGNDLVWGFGKNPAEYDKTEFVDRLVNARAGFIKKNSGWKCVRKGPVVKGKLLGGNLRCLLKLAGTEYWPDFNNAVLFLESYMITPSLADYMLEQLKQMGIFDQICGVIIGYIYGLQTRLKSGIQMEDLILRKSEKYSFPVLKINEFGHVCANTVLPIGAEVSLDTVNLNIEISDKCVE